MSPGQALFEFLLIFGVAAAVLSIAAWVADKEWF